MNQFNQILAAGSLVLAVGNASAGLVEPGPSGSGVASSVVFSAFDNNPSSSNYLHTFVFDLSLQGNTGLNFSSFVNNSQGNSVTWDLSTGPLSFSKYAADLSSLNWSVVGGKGDNYDGASWGVISTIADATDFKNKGGNAIVAALSTTAGVGAWLNNINNNTFNAGVNLPVGNVLGAGGANTADEVPLSATHSYYDTYNSTYGIISSGFSQTFTGATTAEFALDTTLTNPGVSNNTTRTNLGAFVLGTASNGDVTLTYTSANQVSAVPLPTGAWLFLSGLMGVMGLKRRNQAKAA